MFKSFNVQCVLFGWKSGLFVSKSGHKKWEEWVRMVFPKNNSDNTVTQVKREIFPDTWLLITKNGDGISILSRCLDRLKVVLIDR